MCFCCSFLGVEWVGRSAELLEVYLVWKVKGDAIFVLLSAILGSSATPLFAFFGWIL